MTIPSVSPAATRSRTLATFGWSMEVRIDRSCKNRATTSVSETSSGLSTFTATGAPDPRTVPRNTWPIAPRPSSPCSTYRLPKGVSTRLPPLLLRSVGIRPVGSGPCWFNPDVRDAWNLHGGDTAALDESPPERDAGGEDRQRQPDAERSAVERVRGFEQQSALEFRELGGDAAQRAHAVGHGGREDPVPAISQRTALGEHLLPERGAGQQLSIIDDQDGLVRLGQDRLQGTGRLGARAGQRQTHQRRGDGAGQDGGPRRNQDEGVSGLRQRAGLNSERGTAAGTRRTDDQEPGCLRPHLAEIVAADAHQDAAARDAASRDAASRTRRQLASLLEGDGDGQRIDPERPDGRLSGVSGPGPQLAVLRRPLGGGRDRR